MSGPVREGGGGEAVIFTGAQASKGGPGLKREPKRAKFTFFKSYFKILPGPRIKSTILSTALLYVPASKTQHFPKIMF
jgi:hypothetical protein